MNASKNPIENMAETFQKLCSENLMQNPHYKNSEEFAGKVAGVSLSLAQKSVEINNEWSKEIMAQMEKATSEIGDPNSYAKALNDLANETAKVSAKKLTTFANLIQNFQKETTQAYMDMVKSQTSDLKPQENQPPKQETTEPPKSEMKAQAASTTSKEKAKPTSANKVAKPPAKPAPKS